MHANGGLDRSLDRREEQRMKTRRGFSLSLVLLVATIVMVVGAAIAALSSMSLNVTAQMLGRARAETLARSVVAQLRWELDQRVWNRTYPNIPHAFPDMAYARDALRKRFATLPLFPDQEQQAQGDEMHAWVDFNRPDWYSVDNLFSPTPTGGWADRGTTRTSVPPFSVDLVITTGVGDDPDHARDVRHFEAVISRVWPYAAYGVYASTLVNGASQIRGSVYDFASTVQIGSAALTDAPANACDVRGDIYSGLPQTDTPVKLLNTTLSGHVRYDVPGWGMSEVHPNPMSLFDVTKLLLPFADPLDATSTAEPLAVIYQPLPTGDFRRYTTVAEFQAMLGHQWPGTIPIPEAYLHQTNNLLNKVTIWRGSPLQPLTDLNPYRGRIDFRAPFSQHRPIAKGETDIYAGARVMVDSMTLENGYYFTPSLTNHFAVVSGEKTVEDLWTGNPRGPATMRLNNAVLRVDGDLDVRDLWGDNSTLQVNGDLYLNGGRLEAGNKGMLIIADNVIMETHGDFRGLIAARKNLVLQPLKTGERLSMRGAVLCGGQRSGYTPLDASGQACGEINTSAGSLIISSTALQYDCKYTRALNRLGVTRTLIFREQQ